MRSLTLFIVGILLGAGFLGYGYIRLQEAQQQEFIITTQSTIVTQLQGLSNLVTAQMTLSKTIEGKKDIADLIPGFGRDDSIRKVLFNDALLMTIEAKVNAGVDFSKLSTGAVKVEYVKGSGLVDLVLPKAEIFDVYLTDKTKPFERTLGILSRGNQELETKMRNDALNAVRQEALDTKILETAQENADKTMRDFLSKFGVTVRTISFQ